MTTTTTPVNQPHPAARLFSEEARRAVAEGPLFDRRRDWDGDIPMVREDGYCVAGALCLADGIITEPVIVLREMKRRWPSGFPHLLSLVAHCDDGKYRDRAALRRDLLGEETPR